MVGAQSVVLWGVSLDLDKGQLLAMHAYCNVVVWGNIYLWWGTAVYI